MKNNSSLQNHNLSRKPIFFFCDLSLDGQISIARQSDSINGSDLLKERLKNKVALLK